MPVRVVRRLPPAPVVEELAAKGAIFLDDLSEVPRGALVVFSAHGVAPAVRAEAAERGLRTIDATCPLVNKVHAEARRYADSGHLVALVGHENHVEVIGTLGERPDSTIVIESPEQARELGFDISHDELVDFITNQQRDRAEGNPGSGDATG